MQDRDRVSTRKAAQNSCIARATMYYKKKSDPLVQSLWIAIRDAASKRPRFGCRRILVLVRRDGYQVGETRLLRLYREEGLSLRQKSPKRRRSAVVRQPKSVAGARNEIWSMDFMHDRLSNGRMLRLLTVVDRFTRECIALEIAYGFKSMDVITALRRAIARRGKPQTPRCDMVANLRQRSSISGATGTRSRLTSPGLVNQLITRTSSRSKAACARNCSTHPDLIP